MIFQFLNYETQELSQFLMYQNLVDLLGAQAAHVTPECHTLPKTCIEVAVY